MSDSCLSSILGNLKDLTFFFFSRTKSKLEKLPAQCLFFHGEMTDSLWCLEHSSRR